MTDPTQPIVDFLGRVAGALGIAATVSREDTADGTRLNYEGDQAELLARHRGEPLKALQHIVDSAFGRDVRDERRGFLDAPRAPQSEENELRRNAAALGGKKEKTGG